MNLESVLPGFFSARVLAVLRDTRPPIDRANEVYDQREGRALISRGQSAAEKKFFELTRFYLFTRAHFHPSKTIVGKKISSSGAGAGR